MGAVKCVWYVSGSGFNRPWEAAVVGNLAAAIGTRCAVKVYTEGGTESLRFNGAHSWKSLTFFERVKIVLFMGNLWHLWGSAPSWWGLVRLRARTIHTSLDPKPCWKGRPTRFFAEQSAEGESRLVPTFDVKGAWADGDSDEGAAPTLLMAAQPDEALLAALAESGIKSVPLDGLETDLSLKSGTAVFVDDSPSNALLASYLAMRGVPVLAAAGASLLKTVLGPDGCTSPKNSSGGDPKAALKDAWKEALGKAMSEAGRAASASARHFLKENYSPSASADSLEKLYNTTMA